MVTQSPRLLCSTALTRGALGRAKPRAGWAAWAGPAGRATPLGERHSLIGPMNFETVFRVNKK